VKDRPQPKPETMSKDTAEKLMKIDLQDFEAYVKKLKCEANKKFMTVIDSLIKNATEIRKLISQYRSADLIKVEFEDGRVVFMRVDDIVTYGTRYAFNNAESISKHIAFTNNSNINQDGFRTFVENKALSFESKTIMNLKRDCLLATIEKRNAAYMRFNKAIQDFINDVEFINNCWKEYCASGGTIRNNNC
jgi:translation initiation factor 1 (eIF-1/SUI1)